MKQNRQALIHLTLISGVGPATACKIIAYLLYSTSGQTPERNILLSDSDLLDRVPLEHIYACGVSDFIRMGFSERIAHLLVQGLADRIRLDEELALIQKYSIRIDTILDAEYPLGLRHIHAPPIILYSKGAPLVHKLGAKRIAFVGSRKADKYAAQAIDHLVPGLVSNGWEIVSGGAAGVDSMAHKAALDAGGKTIVVLGAGLMRPYPEQNKKFFKKIVAQGGTLVSSFPLRMPPDKTTFPARNRIIAGLSQGCVVVQAARRSGALITAEFALQQGRHVFAIPGSIFNELSDGCHMLLDHGAKVVRQLSDILGEFGEYPRDAVRKAEADVHPVVEPIVNHVSNHGMSSAEPAVSSDPFLAFFSGTHTTDELSERSGLGFAELQDKLFCLQLDGLVKQNFAGYWEKI